MLQQKRTGTLLELLFSTGLRSGRGSSVHDVHSSQMTTSTFYHLMFGLLWFVNAVCDTKLLLATFSRAYINLDQLEPEFTRVASLNFHGCGFVGLRRPHFGMVG